MAELKISEALKNLLQPSTNVAVLTGAGVSAESGVPTFRGKDGLWAKFRPEELANFDAFIANPKLVWEWYNYRRKLMNEVEPNPGHYTLAEWETYFADFALITQNVDSLHRRAGSTKIYELHGNIARNKCADCNAPMDWEGELDPDNIPRCACGGLIRPDVVWFGELLPAKVIEDAWHKAESCDLFFALGTSSVVQPAASLPLVARRAGAHVVEINPEQTPISDMCDDCFRGPTGEILPQLTQYLSQ